MSAQPIPFPPREPTYAQLKAQIVLLQAELAVVRRERDLYRQELTGLQTLLQVPQ